MQELSAEQTLAVLASLRDEFARTRGVTVSDEILQRLVTFAGEFLRNRFFPDKAVDLLEQCVANSVAQGKKVVEPADAQNVAQRMVGMPLALEERLATLKERLYERALLTDDDAEALLRRFEVTLRGLDLQPSRPNAVVDDGRHLAPGAAPGGPAPHRGGRGGRRRRRRQGARPRPAGRMRHRLLRGG